MSAKAVNDMRRPRAILSLASKGVARTTRFACRLHWTINDPANADVGPAAPCMKPRLVVAPILGGYLRERYSFSMTPRGLWPSVRPLRTGYSPFRMCTSIPQIVVVVIRTSASSGPISGIGLSSSAIRPGRRRRDTSSSLRPPVASVASPRPKGIGCRQSSSLPRCYEAMRARAKSGSWKRIRRVAGAWRSGSVFAIRVAN